MTAPTVKVNSLTPDQHRQRVRLLLGILIVHCDPERRNVQPLAAKINMTRQHINSMIQRGKCSDEAARRLEKAFGKELAPRNELCWSLNRN